MFRRLTYEAYLDKVHGCWLGKSLGGTLGGPYEGRKQLFAFAFDAKAVAVTLPNDDLDLQVLWLHVLEQKGLHLTSRDLAEAFARLVPYAPGEYAIFKKNYARGLYPPLTGSFNNDYYIHGMGCPIRAEIWACICPGDPARAAAFCALDGVLDHAGDSVYAEQYLASIEAEAFFQPGIPALLEHFLPVLPDGTRIRRLAEDTLGWCDTVADWQEVRRRILRDYGHPDCTNLYQNIGITLLALKHGRGDFLRTQMIAVNSGYDADCTCATAGAMLGIIAGGAELTRHYPFLDPAYQLGIPLQRRSLRLDDLSADTCRVGVACAREFASGTEILDAPASTFPVGTPRPPLVVETDYASSPVIRHGDTKRLSFRISADARWEGTVTLTLPADWTASWTEHPIALEAGGTVNLPLEVTVPASVPMLSEQNLLELRFAGTREARHIFGLVGAQVWKVFGPFWKNFLDIPAGALGASYYPHLERGSADETTTLTREYHLNALPAEAAADIAEPDGSETDPQRLRLPSDAFIIAQTEKDRFAVGELIGYQGPCTVYAERLVHCPEERTVCLQVGHTDAYRLWLNGCLVSSADEPEWWTGENRHRRAVILRKGENHLLLKLARSSGESWFSVVFTAHGACSDHISDLGSVCWPSQG